jgi:hypothetical protein
LEGIANEYSVIICRATLRWLYLRISFEMIILFAEYDEIIHGREEHEY